LRHHRRGSNVIHENYTLKRKARSTQQKRSGGRVETTQKWGRVFTQYEGKAPKWKKLHGFSAAVEGDAGGRDPVKEKTLGKGKVCSKRGRDARKNVQEGKFATNDETEKAWVRFCKKSRGVALVLMKKPTKTSKPNRREFDGPGKTTEKCRPQETGLLTEETSKKGGGVAGNIWARNRP